MKSNQTAKTLLFFFAILMALTVFLQGCDSAKEQSAAAATDEFQVSFKLDSRLSGATYGGQRWVPPPYGPIAYSGIYTVEAQTFYLDSDGRQVGISAEWIPADPKMVTVTPDQGYQVTITIQDIGETSLVVKSSQGVTKTLYVRSAVQNESIRLVEISQ